MSPIHDLRTGSLSTRSRLRTPTENGRDAGSGRLAVRSWARAHGRELLFVDGNHFLLEVTARAFQGVGACCRTAASHDDAVRRLQTDPMLRAAILDFEMTDGDVGTLVRRLRTVCPAIRLVGTSLRDRREEFARRGVQRFVPKPWRLADLVEAVSA